MSAGSLRAVVLAIVLTHAPLAVGAQEGPQGPIEITVGSGTGATPDLMMKRVARVLGETGLVPQPIVVTNRPGDNWAVATRFVLSQEGNQNLMVAIVPTLLTNPILRKQPKTYDQLSPVGMLVRMNLVLVARADGADADLATMTARVRRSGDVSVRFGGENVGTTDHIVASLIDRATGIRFRYVPFDGGGDPLMSAFWDGSVDVILLTLDEAAPLIESGRVRPLAVLADERVDIGIYADVPTAREQGVDVVWSSWYGIAGAPGLSSGVVAWWDDKLSRMIETQAWHATMADNFLVTDYIPSSEMRAVLDRLHDDYATVINDLDLADK